jgi:VIT1/CCC1 family predicted Fe2+/Mn2+ transporter
MTTLSEERAPPDPNLILANWRHELDSAHLYHYLAALETDAEKAAILAELADAEVRHARVMEASLQELGIATPRHRLGFRTRVLKLCARLFGPRVCYSILLPEEIGGTAEYALQDAATAALAGEERAHARTLARMASAGPAAHERWHRTGAGGALRAGVFGINDGLVSNLSLVMGFAGAKVEPEFVLLAGLAGLIAGASSMAAGEYVSMRAQRELLERQIELEEAELHFTPGEEEEELALIYRAKGVQKAEAERLAARILEDREVALDTLVREELGLDPGELGSPWSAAASSFLAFALGAILPVVPYFTGADLVQVVVSCAIGGTALFIVGAAVSVFTGRSALASGLRQLAIGGVAAAITFGIGRLIGVSTGI